MIATTSWISKNYNKYNNLYWDGQLPNIEFKLSHSKKTWGYASYRYNLVKNTVTPIAITLSNYYDSPEDVKLSILLHEMIHIADYTLHPEHFVKNNKRVSKHKYNAHGCWFMNEANRINKFGWKIATHVTTEEKEASTLSDNTKRKIENKNDVALICVISGDISSWMFKTNTWYASIAVDTVSKYRWDDLGKINSVKFYKFNNENLAQKRSCGKTLRGWKYTIKDLEKKLSEINAVEVNDYNDLCNKTIVKIAA